MRVWHEAGGIEYGPLDESTLAGAIDCVSNVFISAEPMSKHLGITLDEFLLFANAVYPKIAEEGLSFVARDPKIGKIVGVRISEDYVQDAEDVDIPGLSEKFYPLFGLLAQMGERFYQLRNPKKGQYIHLFMIAVRNGYQGRGVAPTMNKIFFKHVIEQGFTHAVTEPTGAISQHILINKFGFNILDEIKYADYEFEGEKVFKDIKGHRGVMLLERSLAGILLGQ